MGYRKGIAALAVMFADTDLTEMLRDVDGANVGAVLKEVQEYREAGGPTLAFSRLLSRGAEQRPGEYLETNLAPVLASINTAMRSVPLPSIVALLTFSGGYRPDVAEEIANKIWRTQETRAIVQFCDHVADALAATNTGDLAHATSHVLRAWSLLDRLSSDIRQEPSLYFVSDLLRTMYIQVAFPAVVAFYAAYRRFPVVLQADGSPRLPDYKRLGFNTTPTATDVSDVAQVGTLMGLTSTAFGDPAATSEAWAAVVRQYGMMQTTALKPVDVQRDPALAKLLLWSGQGWNTNVLDSFVQAANLLKVTARLVASPIAPGVFAAIAKEMRRAKTHADVALGFETAMVTLNKRGLSEQGGYEETGGFFMLPMLAKVAGGLLGGGGGGGLLGGLLGGGGGGGGLLGGLLGGGGGGGGGGLLGSLPGGQLIGGLLKNLPFGSLLSGLFGGGRPQQSAPVQGAMGMFSGLSGLTNDTQRAQASAALDSSSGQGPGILSGLLGSLLGKGGPDDEETGGRRKRRKRKKRKSRVVDTEVADGASDREASRVDSLLDRVEDLQDQLAEAKAAASQGVPGVQSAGGGFSGSGEGQSTSDEFADPMDEIDAVATGGNDEEGGVIDETGGNASNDNNALSDLT